jgi:RNA polymerase sigma-70 factor (ECF subfamily)
MLRQFGKRGWRENGNDKHTAAGACRGRERTYQTSKLRASDGVRGSAVALPSAFPANGDALVANPEDAEDAVQDALLSAFKHVARFEGRAQMSSWLTAIVINAARMQLRRRPRQMILSLDQSLGRGPSAIADLLADPKPTPEQALEQRELRELVIKLTASLPPSQRVAMRLRQRDDLSTKEAAEALGVPKGTLKARLARGRAEVKQQVRKLMDSPSVARSKARRKTSPGSQCRHALEQGAVPLAIRGFEQPVQVA